LRILASAVWHKDAVSPRQQFADCVPQPGRTQSVWVPEYELPQDAPIHLLWCPPYSEQNGWDQQPSEIPLSQIVTGRVLRTEPGAAASARPLGTNEVRCDVSVQSRVPLLDCVQANARVPPAVVSPMPSRDAHVVWQHVRWCGTAQIGGFTYVSALSGEAHVEMLLKRQGGTMVVNFEQYWVDGWSECAIGSWEINDPMLQTIENHLNTAQVLLDQAPRHIA
jgi:hypothetical protein